MNSKIQGGICILTPGSQTPEVNKTPTLALLVRAGERVCALPLSAVAEIMRPLPIKAVPQMPPIVEGLSVVRGEPVPVVRLECLLGGAPSSEKGRFVSLKVSERRVILLVEEVIGLRDLEVSIFQRLPPLLGESPSEVVSMVGVLDQQLMLLMETLRLIPKQVWASLDGRKDGEGGA